MLWDVCYNYQHSDFGYDSTYGHVSHYNNVQESVPNGAIGINPKVLLATLQAESGYGTSTSSLFGSLGSRGAAITDSVTMKAEFQAQLDVAVERYVRFYYYGLYYKANFPDLYTRGDAHGSGGGSYIPANAAMFSRGQYCTEGLKSQLTWQSYFRAY